MALCTCCNQYEGCMLPKRKYLDGENAGLRLYHIFSPCKEFERMEGLGKGRYEVLKTHLVSVQENVRIRSKPVINLDNLMEITKNELLEGPVPGDLYLEFLNLNMNDTGQILDFLCRDGHTALLDTLIFSSIIYIWYEGERLSPPVVTTWCR